MLDFPPCISTPNHVHVSSFGEVILKKRMNIDDYVRHYSDFELS